jgi:hypothetical protein
MGTKLSVCHAGKDGMYRLMEQYHLTQEEAERRVEACWNTENAETAEKTEV